jgi:hypothetical protein
MIPSPQPRLTASAKAYLKVNWLGNDTIGYMGRSLLDLMRSLIGRRGSSWQS